MRFSLPHAHTLSDFHGRIQALVSDLTAHAEKQTKAAEALTEHLKVIAHRQATLTDEGHQAKQLCDRLKELTKTCLASS